MFERHRSARAFTIGALSLVTTLALASAWAQGSPKFAICHIPPGNPENWHTIVVGERAVPAHLAHGDLLESCLDACEQLCDDGNLCTQDVISDPEECLCVNTSPRPPVICDDMNPCTADGCDADQGCTYLDADGETCEAPDGNLGMCLDGMCEATPSSCEGDGIGICFRIENSGNCSNEGPRLRRGQRLLPPRVISTDAGRVRS